MIAGDAGRSHAAEDNLRLLEPRRMLSVHAALLDLPRRRSMHNRSHRPGERTQSRRQAPSRRLQRIFRSRRPPEADHRGAAAAAPLPPEIEAPLQPCRSSSTCPSMWRYKAWPVESFRELIATLVTDGHQVVLTGGPSPSDKRAVAEMAQVAPPPHVVDVCGRLDFAQLATLLRRSALYIGTDTSVTHLAAACSVPTIALFGPTNPMRWGPLDAALPIDQPYAMRSDEPQRRGRVILMQGPGACVPCAGRGCEGHDESRSACLDALLPEQVIAEARAVLGRAARSGRAGGASAT